MAKKKQETWDQMTPNQRKVALCRDVIAQINAKKISLKRSFGYVRHKSGYGAIVPANKAVGAVTKAQCSTIKKNCSMCARGALLISRIGQFNKITWSDISRNGIDVSETTNGLNGSFTDTELKLIEAAFERKYHYAYDVPGSKEAELFGKDHSNDASRMMAICQSIIDQDVKVDFTDRYKIV